MDSKKRKVDSENRKFLSEWTDQYCFTLPDKPGSVPVCLICNKTVAIIKSSNLKRHYETNHVTFHDTFPPGSLTRKQKLNTLAGSFKSSTAILVRSMNNQEKSTEAALRVSWKLNKHQKPFSDSEIVKECMLEIATALFEEKKDVIDGIKSIPLSARSNTRRTEILADDNKKSLLKLVKKAPCYALALDESCDIVDDEQMSVFVRFFEEENKIMREELLTVLTFKGKTRGEDLFETFDDFMQKSNIPYEKMVSISTDGAPAMIGKDKGLVKRIKDKNPNLLSYQCIIHQAALCGKLSASLQAVMDKLIKLINFMRSRSALQHRQFKVFLSECDSAYSDLIQHNNVRWLSKGQVIERFWEIKETLIAFLETTGTQEAIIHLDFLKNEHNMFVVAFLKDILKHLNDLNIHLQGNGKLICHLVQSVSSFRRKLSIFETDIKNQEYIHFPTMAEQADENLIEDIKMISNFITQLKLEFEERFQDFTQIEKFSQFLIAPLEISPSSEWTDVAMTLFSIPKASLQMEIIDIQEDVSLLMCKTLSPEEVQEFWCMKVQDKYVNCKKLALNLITMFGSTYICESSFSKMNFLKNKYRSRLTDSHLEDSLRIACSQRVPDFKKMAMDKRCNFSH